MRRKGYDDPVSLAGVYQIDDNGNVDERLRGYKKFDGSLDELEKKIISEGIKGYGKLYLTGGRIFYNFDQLKDYAKTQVKDKDKSLEDL